MVIATAPPPVSGGGGPFLDINRGCFCWRTTVGRPCEKRRQWSSSELNRGRGR
ncbi:hypothetical protein Hanom_Chr03g00213591 [Helianthus anomalus]